MPDLPHEALDLYELEPNEFVAARNALARRFKTRGQSAEAARVSKLRRPSQVAWALNQVSRQRTDLIRALLEAGEDLRGAVTNAVKGNRASLSGARTAEESRVEAAIDAASQFFASTGRHVNDSDRVRMQRTLRAAIIDDGTRDLLLKGILETDMDAPGFGLDLSDVRSLGSTRGGSSPLGRDRRRQREVTRDLRAALEQARVRAVQAEAAAREAERRARDLRRRAGIAAAAVGDAEARLSQAERPHRQ